MTSITRGLFLLMALSLLVRDSAGDWQSDLKELLNAEGTVSQRVAASQRLLEATPPAGFQEDNESVKALQAVAASKETDPELRKSALGVLYLLGPESLQLPAVKIVNDATSPMALRTTAFDLLRTVANFESSQEKKAAISEQLMPVFERPQDPLYGNVVQYLASEANPRALEAAAEAIAAPGKTKLSPADAILALGSQDPRKYYAYVRPALTSEDPATRGLAVDFLGADQESREQIRGYFANAQQPSDVRRKAARALANYDPDYPVIALKALANDGAFPPELQAYTIRQISHATCNGAYGKVATPPMSAGELFKKVQDLRAQKGNPLINKAVDQFQKDLQKSGVNLDGI